MKNSLCLLLIFAMVLALLGCSQETPAGAEPTGTIPATVPTTTPTDPTPCAHIPEIVQTISATCTENGRVISTCPRCGEELTEEIPTLEHSFTAATCTEAPMCTLCGYISGRALGHVYQESVCIHCGDELPQDLPTDCSHHYVLVGQIHPTCTSSGRMDYQCQNCNHKYSQTTESTGHTYLDATCVEAQVCKLCADQKGQPLGHHYDDSTCTRCGAADPTASREVTYTITIRSDKGAAVEGVTVNIFTDDDTPAATGRTNSKGVAKMTLMSADSYRVILSNIPAGLKARESYTFRSTQVNINLTTVPMISPTDHSQANYKTGSTMGDFTLTDTDGNTFNLYQLLKEKDLVILNFWFVNCGPCKAEFPYFEAVNQKYGNVQLLTMNHIDSSTDILELRAQMGITFPMISENIGFQQGFGIQAYPTTVFIDPNGKILKIHLGEFHNLTQLESLIESLI